MYAVMKTGGKQYRVAKGDIVDIEKLDGDAGATVEFDEVLMVKDGDAVTIGTPMVANAKVAGTIVEQKKARKIVVFKFKQRQRYRRKAGHRQQLTRVRITDISM